MKDPSRAIKRSLPERLGAMVVNERKAVDGVAESGGGGFENRNREVARRTCLVVVTDGTRV